MATETRRERTREITRERAAIARLLATPPKDSLIAGWKVGINPKTNISFFVRAMTNVFTWSAWLINNSRFQSVLSYPFGIVISSTSSTVSPKPGLKVCWPPRSLRNSSKVCVFCIKISNKINGSVNKHKKYAVLKSTRTEIAQMTARQSIPAVVGLCHSTFAESAEDFCLRSKIFQWQNHCFIRCFIQTEMIWRNRRRYFSSSPKCNPLYSYPLLTICAS